MYRGNFVYLGLGCDNCDGKGVRNVNDIYWDV